MSANKDADTFTVTVSFPTPAKIHHLGDWQAFESVIVHSCSTRLVRNRAGQVVPDLAESWLVSPDQKTIVFKLRKNALFVDRTPVEAKHAAFAITRHIALNGQYSDSMRQDIVDADKIRLPNDKVAGIEVTDKHTLTVKLRRIAPEFFSDLGMLSFSIFKEQDVSLKIDSIKLDFSSSGPYKVAVFRSNLVELDRNVTYWNKDLLAIIPSRIRIVPNTNTTDVQRLINGDVDVARASESSIDKEILNTHGIQSVPTGINQYYLDPDFKGPTLSIFPQLSILLNIAFDRGLLVKDLQKDKQHGLIPITAFTGNIQAFEEAERIRTKNLESDKLRAKKDLADIGKEMRKKGLAMRFARRTQNPLLSAVSNSVYSQLISLGIPVETEVVTSAFTYRNKRQGEFDLYINNEPFDTEKPVRALKFIVGTDPERINIAQTHPVFEIVSRKPLKYEEHLTALRDFNAVNEKTGFSIPIFTDRTLLLFAARINISRVTINDFIWQPADVSIKKEVNGRH